MARAPESAFSRSFWWSSTRAPGSKFRSIIRWPWSSRTRDEANPPRSAWRTFAGSTPALAAKRSASPTASMVRATTIWFATLVV